MGTATLVAPGISARSIANRAADDRRIIEAFPTALGWMALAVSEAGIAQLTFAHASPRGAILALQGDAPSWTADEVDPISARGWAAKAVARLKRYADGAADDLLDLPLDQRSLTDFQRRVVAACRRIPLGETCTYGELGRRAGFDSSGRAVGRVMATNRVPLIVPCHRVVASGGGLRGYSGAEGLATKRRLLDLEAAAVRPRRPEN